MTLAEALRELLKYPFDTRGKWSPVWANARASLAAHDAQSKYVSGPITECEACMTPDACTLRGQCAHYLREHDAQQQEPLSFCECGDQFTSANRGVCVNCLASQQQEPVGWLCEMTQEDGTTHTQFVDKDPDGLRWNDAGMPSPYRTTPLYTHPPQDAKDASRYRWLLKNWWFDITKPMLFDPLLANNKDELDAAIDAAMKEQP
jgi:hypothetical protein